MRKKGGGEKKKGGWSPRRRSISDCSSSASQAERIKAPGAREKEKGEKRRMERFQLALDQPSVSGWRRGFVEEGGKRGGGSRSVRIVDYAFLSFSLLQFRKRERREKGKVTAPRPAASAASRIVARQVYTSSKRGEGGKSLLPRLCGNACARRGRLPASGHCVNALDKKKKGEGGEKKERYYSFLLSLQSHMTGMAQVFMKKQKGRKGGGTERTP